MGADGSKPTSAADVQAEDEQQSAEWADRLRRQRFFNDNSAQKESKWGYDLYPERRKKLELSLTEVVTQKKGTERFARTRCEKNVMKCFATSPLVRLMSGALESAGCPFDLRRHISCEVCDDSVTGGYDPELNQIVICQNSSSSAGFVQGVLTHEMIHMFDYCTNKLDFRNAEHLACTEIRAANLAHCSFLGAYAQTDADLFNIKKRHRDCVKSKAVYSVLAVRRDISKDEAIAIVEKVFPKCYADLEPFGRRIRSGSADQERAYEDAVHYGHINQ